MPTTMRSWVAVVAVLCLAACQGKRNAACVGALPGVPPGRPADSKRRQDNSHGGGRWRGLAATLYLRNACACSPGADAEWTMPKRGPRGDATCAGGKCQKVRPGAQHTRSLLVRPHLFVIPASNSLSMPRASCECARAFAASTTLKFASFLRRSFSLASSPRATSLQPACPRPCDILCPSGTMRRACPAWSRSSCV